MKVEGQIGAVAVYVIYDNQSDYPGKHIVRRWVAPAGSNHAVTDAIGVIAHSLDHARRCLPHGLRNIGRGFETDPCIVEIWT